jgi:hypothetical protein
MLALRYKTSSLNMRSWWRMSELIRRCPTRKSSPAQAASSVSSVDMWRVGFMALSYKWQGATRNMPLQYH